MLIKPSFNLVARAYESFTNGVPPGAQFTRASSAWRTNRYGAVERVSAGVLRHDYDAGSGEYKGWLMEAQATNVLLYSEQLDAGTWGKDGSTIGANVAVAPDGTLSADKVQASAANASHGVYQVVSWTATTYTVSVYVKAVEYLWAFVQTDDGTGKRAYYNLSDGTLGTVATGVTADIRPAGNGWWRLTHTRTMTAGTGSIYLGIANGNNAGTFAGNGTYGIAVWGAMLEAGNDASSYIQTGAATVTRAADVLSVPVSASWLNSAEGTVAVSFTPTAAGTSTMVPLAVDDGGSNQVYLAWTPSTGALVGQVQPAGVSLALGTLGARSSARAALTYKAASHMAALNGVAAAPVLTGAVPTGLTTLRIGSVIGLYPLSGWVRHVAYWPRQMSSVDLQTITA